MVGNDLVLNPSGDPLKSQIKIKGTNGLVSKKKDCKVNIKVPAGLGIVLAIDRVRLHNGDSLLIDSEGDLEAEWKDSQHIFYGGRKVIETKGLKNQLTLHIHTNTSTHNPVTIYMTIFKCKYQFN